MRPSARLTLLQVSWLLLRLFMARVPLTVAGEVALVAVAPVAIVIPSAASAIEKSVEVELAVLEKSSQPVTSVALLLHEPVHVEPL